MALSNNAASVLSGLGEQLGLAWQSNVRRTRGSDELLNISIGDGIAPTKIDGWIHACTVTARAMVAYAADADRGLDIVGVTSWSGGNSALRYARWQADFHWKIDTRMWQFFLYMFPMRWAFRDAIKEAEGLNEEDRTALLDLNDEFWEVVTVAYVYRTEVIERARGFATHPDPNCGSSWQGYPYTKIWERDDVRFEDLAMPFVEKGKVDYKAAAGKIEPKPFPPLEGQMEPGLIPRCAKLWLDEARRRGLADPWLRVRLGNRWVPTRFNGWWSSLEETLRFLEPYAKGRQAQVSGAAALNGCDLRNYAVRFGLCQAEFQRRLNGEAQQLIDLLGSQGAGLEPLLRNKGADVAALGRFLDESFTVIREVFETKLDVDGETLPELQVVRPIHPRYAPPDPLEPLHWEVPNTARYLKKMANLGYTL